MVARSVEDIQLVNLAADPVQLPMKVFYSWRVALLKLIVEKPVEHVQFSVAL